MKHVTKLSALAACLLLIAAPFASAQSQEEPLRSYTLPNFTVEGVSDPELQSYVTPRIPSYLIGSNITLYYTINEEGKVQSVRSNASITEKDLDAIMTKALRKWQFAPATNSSGDAVAIKVAMPVEVVAYGTTSNAYASISIKGMTLAAKSS